MQTGTIRVKGGSNQLRSRLSYVLLPHHTWLRQLLHLLNTVHQASIPAYYHIERKGEGLLEFRLKIRILINSRPSFDFISLSPMGCHHIESIPAQQKDLFSIRPRLEYIPCLTLFSAAKVKLGKEDGLFAKEGGTTSLSGPGANEAPSFNILC